MKASSERLIIGFHQDQEGDWVAELDCGHNQHVRHDPPWQERAWVLSSEGRGSRLGTKLICRLCGPRERAMEPETQRMTERVRAELIRAALAAYEDAAVRGLCAEGAWEVAVDAMRKLDLSPAVEQQSPTT